MKLPRTDDETAIAAVVAEELAALDERKRLLNWRYRALGGKTKTEILAEVPRAAFLDIKIAVGEMRVLRRVCEARGVPMRSYLRAALYTALVALDHVQPELIPGIGKDGLLWPT